MTKSLNPKLFDKDVEMVPTRDGYGEGLVELGAGSQEIVVLTGDLKESTRVEEFAKKFPERFIECGVAEQNMMGIAAGRPPERFLLCRRMQYSLRVEIGINYGCPWLIQALM